MKKRLASAFIAAVIVMAMAPFAESKDVALSGEATISPTNLVLTAARSTFTSSGEWAKLDSFYVEVPPYKTGTVVVATMRCTNWVNLVTFGYSNNTAVAYPITISASNAPLSGTVRLSFTQQGTSTNTWPYLLLIGDGK